MEKTVKVQAYQTRLYCDECGEEMKFTGMSTLMHPPSHKYKCKNDHTQTVKDHYPKIEYRKDGPEKTYNTTKPKTKSRHSNWIKERINYVSK